MLIFCLCCLFVLFVLGPITLLRALPTTDGAISTYDKKRALTSVLWASSSHRRTPQKALYVASLCLHMYCFSSCRVYEKEIYIFANENRCVRVPKRARATSICLDVTSHRESAGNKNISYTFFVFVWARFIHLYWALTCHRAFSSLLLFILFAVCLPFIYTLSVSLLF